MTSGPTGRQEESTQFSLEQLLKLEDERVAEQTRERQAREAASAREREDSERRRLAEAEAKARAEAEAEARRRRGELDEIARREAMQKALVEQSRLEVEVRARADERERERRHEIEIERLRAEGKQGPAVGPLAIAAALGGAIVLVVLLGIQLGVLKPASDRRLAEAEQAVVVSNERVDELARRVDEQRRAIGERDRQLTDAQHQIDTLRRESRESREKNPGTGPARPTRKLGAGPVPTPQPPCLKGDPMCFKLPGNE